MIAHYNKITDDGKSNSLTNPKSSPVANKDPSFVRSEAFMSVISEPGAQIPSQSFPKTPVHVDHLIFFNSELTMACLDPLGASKYRCSLAPLLIWRSFPKIWWRINNDNEQKHVENSCNYSYNSIEK